MKYKVFDDEKNIGIETELEELTAGMTALCFKTLLPELQLQTKEEQWTPCSLEMIKVHAIMVRTELARKLDIYGGHDCERHPGYHICTTPGHCLDQYDSTVKIPEAVRDAVKATRNKIITFNGKPIRPYYHFRCGGASENSENVMGRKITYLRRVLCSYCKDIVDFESEKHFDVEELERLLNVKFAKSEGQHPTIKGLFEDIEIDDQGRIKTIKIGSKTFEGNELVEQLGLNSSRFDYVPTRFLFKSIGKGHGLGLCQCGANEMAKQGIAFEEILKYYYTGVEIEDMELPEEAKPLKGRKFVLDAAFGGENCEDAKGAGGLREKDVNLEIVLKLKELLEEDGASIYLTRDCDKNVFLNDRVKFGNSVKPHFFITIQQNSFVNASARGTELYHYRDDKQGEGLARMIAEELNTSLALKIRGIRTAELYILREIQVSAIVLQLLYLSNSEDEKLLEDANFRSGAAHAIRNAIRRYYAV